MAEKGSSLALDSQCSRLYDELNRTGVSPGAATAGPLFGTEKEAVQVRGVTGDNVKEEFQMRKEMGFQLSLYILIHVNIYI